MRVFCKQNFAKWLLWQGYSTITLGYFIFHQKNRGDEAGTLSP